MATEHTTTIALRRYFPIVFWIVVLGILGSLLLGAVGAFLGVVFGLAWGVCALAGADRYAVYLHGGRPLNRIEAPNLHDILDGLAGEAGIDPPVLYALPFQEANIVVCAGGTHGARARIGLTNGLTGRLEREEVHALMALAVARIMTGEAAVISTTTAAAGLPLQIAQSSWINFTFGTWLVIDPECGMTPIGKALLLIATPFSWATNRLSGLWGGCLEADQFAGRFLKDPDHLARALEKIADATPAPDLGSTAGYNPGTAPAFLVSPFEGMRGISSDPTTSPEWNRPLWQRARLWVARQTPPVRTRVSLLLGNPVATYEPPMRRENSPTVPREHVTWPPTP